MGISDLTNRGDPSMIYAVTVHSLPHSIRTAFYLVQYPDVMPDSDMIGQAVGEIHRKTYGELPSCVMLFDKFSGLVAGFHSSTGDALRDLTRDFALSEAQRLAIQCSLLASVYESRTKGESGYLNVLNGLIEVGNKELGGFLEMLRYEIESRGSTLEAIAGQVFNRTYLDLN